MLKEDIAPFDQYDSDEDPSYIPPPIFDPDLDYDEYSDGEIQVCALVFFGCSISGKA